MIEVVCASRVDPAFFMIIEPCSTHSQKRLGNGISQAHRKVSSTSSSSGHRVA